MKPISDKTEPKDTEKDTHETILIPDIHDANTFPAVSSLANVEAATTNTQSSNSIFGPNTNDPPTPITYPEGGLTAWLVVAGAFCAMAACAGFMNTIGTFHAFLSNSQLAGYGDSDIGWIFSVFTFLAFFLGVQVGPLFDEHGPRALVLAGSVLMTAVLFLLGFCEEYYHFMLVWGVMAGIGFSLIFTPAVSAIGHFFLVRRGNATGIAAAGGSLGGVVYPLLMQALFPKIGFAWTCRVLGFIFIGLFIPANLLIRSRLPRELLHDVVEDGVDADVEDNVKDKVKDKDRVDVDFGVNVKDTNRNTEPDGKKPHRTTLETVTAYLQPTLIKKPPNTPTSNPSNPSNPSNTNTKSKSKTKTKTKTNKNTRPRLRHTVKPDLSILRSPPFALTTAGTFFMEAGLFVPIAYLTSFALATRATSPPLAYHLVAIFNAGSCFGRWLPGYVADRLGRFNTMILMLLLCLGTTVALWLPVDLMSGVGDGSAAGDGSTAGGDDGGGDHRMPLLVTYALLFGFASGSNISLTPVCVGQLCETREYGRYYATCYTITALGTLAGIPLAGALLEVCSSGKRGGDGDDGYGVEGERYYGLILFTGMCYALSTAAYVGARVLKVGWRWNVVY